MRSRIAIILTLVAGLVMTSASAALGVTALTNNPSASAAQYGASQAAATPAATATTPSTTTTPPSSDAAGEQTPDDEAETLGTGTGSSDSASGDDSATAADDASGEAAQPSRQAQANGADSLPFTGYASIPLMLIGIALLATGIVLRRNTYRSPVA